MQSEGSRTRQFLPCIFFQYVEYTGMPLRNNFMLECVFPDSKLPTRDGGDVHFREFSNLLNFEVPRIRGSRRTGPCTGQAYKSQDAGA